MGVIIKSPSDLLEQARGLLQELYDNALEDDDGSTLMACSPELYERLEAFLDEVTP